MMENNVRINVPPPSVAKNEITIAGEKEGVLHCKDVMGKIYKEMVRYISVILSFSFLFYAVLPPLGSISLTGSVKFRLIDFCLRPVVSNLFFFYSSWLTLNPEFFCGPSKSIKALWTIQYAVAHILAQWPSKSYAIFVAHWSEICHGPFWPCGHRLENTLLDYDSLP